MEQEFQGTATILIVDDNPTNLRVLVEYLKKSGFKILVARSGEGALQQIEFARPDIILLDVMMPGMNGFETCQRLKAIEATKEIPVIFMTALTETVDKVRGFEAGGVDYITKPLQHEEVAARIATHLTIRRLQQQLQAQNTQLHELNASKDKFFSIISHDLRSPLSAVLAMARLLTDEFEVFSQEEVVEQLHDLRDSVENLYALIENLLTWSRLQRGLMQRQPLEFSLNQVVTSNIALFAANAAQKQITLTDAVQETIPVYADKHMIDTVIRNLISNALKFTRPRGAISVSALTRNCEIEVAVADSGIGMNADTLAQIFRIDAKHHSVGTAGEPGTGLGLMLCKDLIERNSGKIWVESTVGAGTTFRFTLPRQCP